LALGALLLVPIVVGRQTRELRDDILARQLPLTMAAETFRAAAANEIAATRAFLVTADTAAADWHAEAYRERTSAQSRLQWRVGDTGGEIGARFLTLVSATAAVPAPSAFDVIASADTARLWTDWATVTAVADSLASAIRSDLDA